MITPDDKTLDMIVFNARQVAVAMSGEYAELAASADDYRTMADAIAALRERIVALEAELFGQYKAPALSAGPLHTSVVPISTAPDCHRDEMP